MMNSGAGGYALQAYAVSAANSKSARAQLSVISQRVTSLLPRFTLAGAPLLLAALVAMAACSGDSENTTSANNDVDHTASGVSTAPDKNLPLVTITMEDGGVVLIQLCRATGYVLATTALPGGDWERNNCYSTTTNSSSVKDTTLNTTMHFVYLVQQRFYDGLTFHRAEPGFVIQGGDPKGDGTGNPYHTIPGEFSTNSNASSYANLTNISITTGNPISHTRGVISMARSSSSPDSAGSQFFIMLATNTGLDGSYAAFGHVIAGMDVVDRIGALTTKSVSGISMIVSPPKIKSMKVDLFGGYLGNSNYPLPACLGYNSATATEELSFLYCKLTPTNSSSSG